MTELDIDLSATILQHLLPETFTDGPNGWPTSPEIASHVLWHFMGREGKTPDAETIEILQGIDQHFRHGDAMVPAICRNNPIHYGYMYLARYSKEGLSILEGVAKIGRTEGSDRA